MQIKNYPTTNQHKINQSKTNHLSKLSFFFKTIFHPKITIKNCFQLNFSNKKNQPNFLIQLSNSDIVSNWLLAIITIFRYTWNVALYS
jgi:hypothetical protein